MRLTFVNQMHAFSCSVSVNPSAPNRVGQWLIARSSFPFSLQPISAVPSSILNSINRCVQLALFLDFTASWHVTKATVSASSFPSSWKCWRTIYGRWNLLHGGFLILVWVRSVWVVLALRGTRLYEYTLDRKGKTSGSVSLDGTGSYTVTDVSGIAGRAESLISEIKRANEINTEERITQQEACDTDNKPPVFLFFCVCVF